jgi:hypothetical protein
MTVARSLAEFLTQVSYVDLAAQRGIASRRSSTTSAPAVGSNHRPFGQDILDRLTKQLGDVLGRLDDVPPTARSNGLSPSVTMSKPAASWGLMRQATASTYCPMPDETHAICPNSLGYSPNCTPVALQ